MCSLDLPSQPLYLLLLFFDNLSFTPNFLHIVPLHLPRHLGHFLQLLLNFLPLPHRFPPPFLQLPNLPPVTGLFLDHINLPLVQFGDPIVQHFKLSVMVFQIVNFVKVSLVDYLHLLLLIETSHQLLPQPVDLTLQKLSRSRLRFILLNLRQNLNLPLQMLNPLPIFLELLLQNLILPPQFDTNSPVVNPLVHLPQKYRYYNYNLIN